MCPYNKMPKTMKQKIPNFLRCIEKMSAIAGQKLKELLEKMFVGNGTGTANDWSYCSSSRPCAHREGDCDNDADCAQDHVCGYNNCINYWNLAETEADCCIPGNLIIITKL